MPFRAQKWCKNNLVLWPDWSYTRGSQLGFRVYEIQNRGMILADSSLILLILQSRFPLNFV